MTATGAFSRPHLRVERVEAERVIAPMWPLCAYVGVDARKGYIARRSPQVHTDAGSGISLGRTSVATATCSAMSGP
jgi:hypothetical protein